MPTVLPPPAAVPWTKLRRAIWLRILVAGLNMRMKWLPATNRQSVAAACQWITYCEELHRLLGLPEPAHVAELREVFSRPLPDGSTLSTPQEISNAHARPVSGIHHPSGD
ncbi:hypothetical protein MEX01_51710 [Methylorubrum extorquens]|uniref:hypothetical protein n=1 Tax=Methylorubrum extorquens TaxID=408 RepID=UPI00116BE297|nr:hypothetical protein [Methylorubrum extorquens]GEL44580.1 hypothetical protein MEX01_51710 [Methylorubrum extorquens]